MHTQPHSLVNDTIVYRHPSNLMLDRLSGKIVHIDFGDCFEVAMKREKYPEKIPFRLTRMLIQVIYITNKYLLEQQFKNVFKAMDVTGIDGNYRLTCERVLRLLRNNNDSILAVLESFVYDPVLNWRLTEGMAAKKAPPQNGGGAVEDKMMPTIGDRNWRPEEAGKPQMRDTKLGGIGNRGDSEALSRVKTKLCGRDFNPYVEISVPEQVDRLIEQATMNDNLCQCYIGWCPFW